MPSVSSAVKMLLWQLLAIQELLVVTEPEHEGNRPKMLEIVKKCCGEACLGIDLASVVPSVMPKPFRTSTGGAPR